MRLVLFADESPPVKVVSAQPGWLGRALLELDRTELVLEAPGEFGPVDLAILFAFDEDLNGRAKAFFIFLAL